MTKIQSVRLLNKGQAAEYLGVSAKTIFNWINKGVLKTYEMKGLKTTRISPEDLDKLKITRDIFIK